MKEIKIVLVLLFLFPKIVSAKIENKIVVKVEDQIITNYEIKNKILTSLILSEKKVNQENINSLKKDVLENLIQLKLKKIELSKYNIKKDDLQTQVYLKSISPSNNVENLKDILKKNNLSYELFLSEIEIELMWQKFIYKIYSNKINIDEKEIVKELEKN